MKDNHARTWTPFIVVHGNVVTVYQLIERLQDLIGLCYGEAKHVHPRDFSAVRKRIKFEGNSLKSIQKILMVTQLDLFNTFIEHKNNNLSDLPLRFDLGEKELITFIHEFCAAIDGILEHHKRNAIMVIDGDDIECMAFIREFRAQLAELVLGLTN